MEEGNVKVETKGNTLTVTVDLSKSLGPSASGKSQVIASTRGNKEIAGTKGAKLGFNLYRPKA